MNQGVQKTPRHPAGYKTLHGCMIDLTTVHSFDAQAMWVIGVLGLFFDMLSMGVVCTTRHW